MEDKKKIKEITEKLITRDESDKILLDLFAANSELKNYRDCKIKCRYREIYSTSMLIRR